MTDGSSCPSVFFCGMVGPMSKLGRLSLILMFVSCGDNIVPEPDAAIDAPPPFTYGDAETVWADAWCAYAERCNPVIFHVHWDTHEECVAEVQEQNCAAAGRGHRCEDLFPDSKRDDLQQCHDDMEVISCSATQAPASCYRAFGYGGEKSHRLR